MNAPSLSERLEALAAFVPVFEDQDFTFGEWDSHPGHMPWFSLSVQARQFVTSASRFGWVVPSFDWPAWQQTNEARPLLTDPQSIERASAADLEHLLTTHIRLDRFSEGHLASAFENGHLTAIARRAGALMRQGETSD
jgi:Family of unknown function (DUF6508)